MEPRLPKIFSKDEKRKVINYTLDNLAMATMTGIFCGGVVYLASKNKSYGLFTFSYIIGASLRNSNDYVINHLT